MNFAMLIGGLVIGAVAADLDKRFGGLAFCAMAGAWIAYGLALLVRA